MKTDIQQATGGMVVWFSKSLCGVSCAPWKMEMFDIWIDTYWMTDHFWLRWIRKGYEKVFMIQFLCGLDWIHRFFGGGSMDRYSMPPTTTTRTCFNWFVVWVDRSTVRYIPVTHRTTTLTAPRSLEGEKSKPNQHIHRSLFWQDICVYTKYATNQPSASFPSCLILNLTITSLYSQLQIQVPF